MAYITPDTTIELYKNVPLDKTYRNTVKYSSSTAQYNDFQQYKYKSYEKNSYQRWGLGTIKLEEKHDNIYDVNYMIFYNPTLKKKIYCFVEGVGYVSNNVTEVYYSIDVLQTYMFNYSFGKCFVEREHVYNDTQGSNTVPEGLELGAIYKVNASNSFNHTISEGGDLRFILLGTSTSLGDQPEKRVKEYNNIPCGLVMYEFSNIDLLNTTVLHYIENGIEDNIVNIYLAPRNLGNYEWSKSITHSTLGSYTPKNKKLLTYPYCFMQVGNNLGNYLELHYEYLSGSGATKTIKYNVTYLNYPQPILVLEPEVNGIFPNRDYQLTYSVFPTVAWSGDSFKVWWAQNKNTYIATMNAIQSNYDTNVAVANNNFQQAVNSASATQQATQNSIASSLTNAEIQKNVSRTTAQNNYDISTQNLSGAIGSGLSTGIESVVNKLTDFVDSSNLGTGTKRLINNYTNNASTLLTNTVNSTNVSALNTLTNSNLSSDASFQQAVNVASTNAMNAELSYSTALKNATISQKSANLTALTTAQNATASLVAKKQDAMHQPSTAHGQSSCDGANAYLGRLGFRFEDHYITEEYAKKIDDYFSMYGYAVNEMKTPSLDNRKYFTYLKTANCNLKGLSMDASTRATIEGIYNNGITTWKALSQVGNYDLDNTPNGEQY